MTSYVLDGMTYHMIGYEVSQFNYIFALWSLLAYETS